jgi:hypothetical protein
VTWVTMLIGVSGIAISALSASAAISDVRAKRFLARSTGLLQLRDAIAAEGPVEGKQASAGATEAHQDLLLQFGQEARANAVLYLDATSRLAKPGSLPAGIGQIIYGAVLVWLAYSRVPWTASTTDPVAIASLVGAGVLLLSAIVIIAIGTWQIIRRLRTRRLRTKVGVIDDLTFEGSAWMRKVPGEVWRKSRRRRLTPDPEVRGDDGEQTR